MSASVTEFLFVEIKKEGNKKLRIKTEFEVETAQGKEAEK
jgi:hypothetical protein